MIINARIINGVKIQMTKNNSILHACFNDTYSKLHANM